MSTQQQVARNFAALGGGEAVSRLVAFATTVYLARVLGAQSYGVIAFAVGANLYLTKIADFAIEAVGTQEVARNDKESLTRLVSAVMGVRSTLTGALVVVSVAAAQMFATEPERTVLSLYFLTLLPIAANTKWVHMGRGDSRAVGLTRVFGEAIALGLVVVAVKGASQLWIVPIAQFLGEVAVDAILYGLLVRAGIALRLSWDPTVAVPIFRRALPLLAQILLSMVIYNSDLILLRFISGTASVGFYASAYTVISFLGNIGVAYCLSLLPTFARLDTDGKRALYQTALAHIFAVCFPVAIGGHFLAIEIVKTAFGTSYLPAGSVLQILVWAVPFSTFRTVPWAALVARGHQNLLLRATAYAVGANVVLNLALIPLFDMKGAAIATVLTELLTAILMMAYGAQQGLGFLPLTRFLKPTAAGLVMGIALAILAQAPLLVRGVAGVVVYGVVLVLLGGIRFRQGALPTLDL